MIRGTWRLVLCGALGLGLGGCGDEGGAATATDTTTGGTLETTTTTTDGTTTSPTTGDDTTTTGQTTTSATTTSPTTGTTEPVTSSTTTDATTTTTTTTTTDSTTDSTSSTTGEPELCGNGQVDDGEVCDDGVNDGAYDGCLPDCSAPGPFCGDGEQNGPEGCDDGNDVDDDACDNQCVPASCGNGEVEGDEGCDDGNDVETDECLATCVLASCGDGVVHEGVEVCDDGVNDGAYDGCAADCAKLGPFCGDGQVNGPEQCDDGNDVDDDVCSNTCTAAFNGVFTNCGATGNLGPSQAMCDGAYVNTDIVVVVAGGIQTWTVPATGTYRIEVWGAEGGVHNMGPGGRGAHVRGDFNLMAGDKLKILVGQEGKDGTSYDVGGGGGSFVARTDNTPLIVAGGGGAAGNCGAFDQLAQNGKSAMGNGLGGNGSNDGGWCGCGGAGSPGAGFTGNANGGGAKAFVNGGAGDNTERPGQCVDSGIGGFGGGGNGGNGGPGGGGYQGGDAGGFNVNPGGPAYGKGGLSYNTGTNPINEDGINVGHGKVQIALL